MFKNVEAMTEKTFENHIKKWLKEHGYWYVKYCAQTRNAKVGCPDILACINGRWWGIEVKRMGGVPSPEQFIQLRAIRAAGGMAVIVYPTGWESFLKMVKSVNENPLDPFDYPEILE